MVTRVLTGQSGKIVTIFGRSKKLFCKGCRMNLGPTQPHTHWIPVAISPGIKRSGREADLSNPFSVVVKNPLQFMSSQKAR